MKRLFLIALLVSGCGLDSDSKDRPSYDGLKAEISANRERWRALALQDYSYRHAKNCFCPLKDFRITVRQGRITEVLGNPDASEPTPVPVDSDDDILTIEDVYDRALEWADRRPDTLDVAFDPTYFFVTKAFIDHDEGAADDSTTLTLSALTRMEAE